MVSFKVGLLSELLEIAIAMLSSISIATNTVADAQTNQLAQTVSTVGYQPLRYLHFVTTYDGVDNRMEEHEYAKAHNLPDVELERNVASSVGEITCGRYQASAEIVVSQSVLTTVGHIFCKSGAPPEKCTFKYRSNNRQYTVSLTNSKISPLDCAKADSDVDRDGIHDWAVLKLVKPATELSPFSINPTLANAVEDKTQVTFVAASTIDFCHKDATGHCVREPRTHRYLYPKFLVDCTVRAEVRRGDGSAFEYATDCPSSLGGSGGALINRNLANPVLIGIQAGLGGEPGDIAREEETGLPVNRIFSVENGWHTVFVTVNGEFAAAIRTFAGSDGGPEKKAAISSDKITSAPDCQHLFGRTERRQCEAEHSAQ